VKPIAYVQNTAFLIKVGLVGLGIVNASLLNRSYSWRLALSGNAPRGWVQLSAFLSLALWVSAIVAGRWIGFL